jgi:Fe2+ transport system protein B
MRAFIESLSLGSGAALVAIISALLAGAISFVRPPIVRWLSVVVVPFVISFCLYRLPVWLGADGSEYSSWQFLFVGAWFLAGVIPSALVVFILGRYAKSHA